MKEMTNDELPDGWCWSSAEELRTSDRYSLSIGPFGSNLKVSDYRDEGVPLVFVREIRSRDFGGGKTKFVTPKKAQELKAHSVSGGDLLITKMGDPPGDVAIYPVNAPDAIITADCIKLTADPKRADTLFLAYAVESPQTKSRLEEITAGVAQQKISLQRFRDFPLPLAPLAEQKRIANKLESLLGRVDACRARLDRVPALLKRFRQSVLAAATSGKLTEEWREEDIERATVPLREAIKTIRTGPFGSSLHKAEYVSGGTPIVNPMHINGGKIIPTNGMTVDKTTLKRLSDFKISTGDVIIGRRGEMGRCAVITPVEDGWLCGTGSMVLTPLKTLYPQYLQIFLSSPATVYALEGESVGSTMVNLNQKILLELEIFFPPLPEQQEIVRRVEALFAIADRIEARLATAQKTIDRLTPATLAKAFRGELAPQDPSDEPASTLLERLHSKPATKPARAKRTKCP